MSNPEEARRIRTGAFMTNYHDAGEGTPVLLIHGSGPGVSAWANWRPVIPRLAERFRVLAPDMVGFGYTERPAGQRYDMEAWLQHVVDFLDALQIPQVHVVGNSFGGALALALTARHPQRVGRLVLMGSAGVSFELTPGLDVVWGYTPSVQNMRKLLDIFAYNRELVSDELAQMRYQASIRSGVQEAFAAMFPAPRQRWVDALATPVEQIHGIAQEALIVHGRDDQVIPLQSSLELHRLLDRSQLHVFGRCGHAPAVEHPHDFRQLLSCFLRRERGRATPAE